MSRRVLVSLPGRPDRAPALARRRSGWRRAASGRRRGAATRSSPEARERIAAAVAAYRAGDVEDRGPGAGRGRPAAAPIREYASLPRGRRACSRLGDAAGARAAAEQAIERAGDGPLSPRRSCSPRARPRGRRRGAPPRAAPPLRRSLRRSRRGPGGAAMRWAQSLEATGARAEALGAVPGPVARRAGVARGRARRASGRRRSPTPASSRRRRRRRSAWSARSDCSPPASRRGARGGRGAAGREPARRRRLRRVARRRGGGAPAGKSDEALRAADRALAASPAERRAPWLLERARLLQRAQAASGARRAGPRRTRAPAEPRGARRAARARPDPRRDRPPADAAAAYQRVAADYPDSEEAGAALWRLGWIAWFRGAHARGGAALDAASPRSAPASASRDMAALLDGPRPRRPRCGQAAARHWRAIAGRGACGATTASSPPRGSRGRPRRRSSRARGARQPAAPTAGASATPAGRASARAGAPRRAARGAREDARYVKVAALRVGGPRRVGRRRDRRARAPVRPATRRASTRCPRRYARRGAPPPRAAHPAARLLHSTARAGHELVPRRFWEMFYPIGWRAELTSAADAAGARSLLRRRGRARGVLLRPAARAPAWARAA